MMNANAMMKTLIPNENRPISSLLIDRNQRAHTWHPSIESQRCIVGNDGITRIEAYNEFGEGDYRLWFAIYVGEEIIWRVNGKYVVEVGYGK